MRFATLADGSRDGRLAVVSRDNRFYVSARKISATLQEALDRWGEVEVELRVLYDALNAGEISGAQAFDPAAALAPLPRAWQWLDGSVFASHGRLMAQSLGITHPVSATPLMYQGMSHEFLPGTADVRLPRAEDGIDFEGEFAIITDHVPMGISRIAALSHIRLIVQINDWSLRRLAGPEMKTGFGWIRAKPACSMAPVALTPDELGSAWRDARVHLDLDVQWNGAPFGHPNGGAMEYGFDELISHAADTRCLCAGTVIGSGTVSNDDYATVGSSCISERRGIEIIQTGAPITSFMAFGDRVRMEARAAGDPLFGAINQAVVPG